MLAEHENNYAETETYLPIGVQANEALVTLEQLAETAKVSIECVTRIADQERIEGVSDAYAQNTYTVQVTSNSSANIQQLINLLMNEERVWNLSAFSYTKSGEENYTGDFNPELYYYSGNE